MNTIKYDVTIQSQFYSINQMFRSTNFGNLNSLSLKNRVNERTTLSKRKQYMPMWRVLHDLCVAEASGFSVNKDEMNDAWSVLMRKGGIVSSDRVVSYVQLHMYAIGYRREIFQSLKAPPSSSSKHNDDESLYDSKELFLATAWFVAHHKMLETYTARTTRETERHCVLPPYSVDTATLPEFDDETVQTSLRIPDDVTAVRKC